MSQARPTVEVLSGRLLNIFPALDADDQRLSLGLYRRLAEGVPVALPALATELALPRDDVARRLAAWPGVYYDAERRVIGYWGLTIKPTTHRLRVDGRDLYAWCAWDTLFLPALLGRTVEVSSVCRGSGDSVRLSVAPGGVDSAEPEGITVSFLVPDAAAVRADVMAGFCQYVHFFSSPDAARPWFAGHPAAFLLSLGEAYEVGRRRTEARYSAVVR